MKGENKEESKSEREYYEFIKAKIEEILNTKFDNFYLEITTDKKFSNKLKAEIPDYRHIIFYFLKEVAPDITGFIKREYSSDFIVISLPGYKHMTLVHFDDDSKEFVDWFPENPFEKGG
jgi:mRNA-degrading endonuclease RelE of RelBE toxin-antitoxin system